MKKYLLVILASFSVVSLSAFPVGAEEFALLLQRDAARSDGGVPGRLYINGEYAGDTLENNAYLIDAGSYQGYMRYYSPGAFALGDFGAYGSEGDFLLEVGGVTGRTNLLFHTGTQPGHSKGCILTGPRINPLPSDHLLMRMRRAFYGTDHPIATPNKSITIEIVGP